MKVVLTKRRIVSVIMIILVIAVFCLLYYGVTPKFHDLTVELGTTSLTIDDFTTEFAYSSHLTFVSDPTKVDLGRVGETELTLKHGAQKETVTLTIVDTTPPAADMDTHYQIPVNEIPDASALVYNIRDASPVSVFYKDEPRVPLDYEDISVTIVMEDAYGNRTENNCIFSFRWMPEAITVEYGEEITKDLLLYNPVRDISFLDSAEITKVRSVGIGEYTITSSFSGKTQECVLTIQDTQGPDLQLRDVQVRYGAHVNLDDFLVSAGDLSGIAEIRSLSELGRKPLGRYPVTIEAEDNAGNITQKEATLFVASDFIAPKITGPLTQLVLEKNTDLSILLDGFSAIDNLDGDIPVKCDVSSINMNIGGTYTAVYRAIDSSGNVTTRHRQIVVTHDEEDTRRLAEEIAATFEDNDIAGMRNYVYYGIGYNHDWGGDDPAWYGFTEKRGNCYVHANCMKALLDAKGIENRLIWTTDETHYWLIVKFNGEWKHIEPTPSTHQMSLFMSDSERLSTLSRRVWDTTQWPSCP